MTLFDKAINAASDIARQSAESYRRTQQRNQLLGQIAFHQQAIGWSLSRVGRMSLEANKAHGAPLPAGCGPAVEAIKAWEADIAELQRQLVELDAQTAAVYTAGHPVVPPR